MSFASDALGDMPKAIELAAEALKHDYSHKAKYILGFYYSLSGRFDEGRQLLEAVVRGWEKGREF